MTGSASSPPAPSCDRGTRPDGMEERARELGGRLQIRSAPGAGATVRLEVPRGMIRVLIVDDHAVVREGLRTFLDLQDGIEVVGEAADGDEGVERPTVSGRT